MLSFGPIGFANFRSIEKQLTLPFSKKITFVIGPNNAGKSNVLRLLGILWNRAFDTIDDLYDFPGKDKYVSIDFALEPAYVRSKIASFQLAQQSYEDVPVGFSLRLRDKTFEMLTDLDELQHAFPRYFNTQNFINDFRQSSTPEANARLLLEKISPLQDLPGTVYLPNLRFITPPNSEPVRFVSAPFPGDTVSFGTVVQQLASMDRPPFEKRYLKERLTQIGDFMAFCLERRQVTIEIPDGRETIHLNIDGDERRISSLGTGVEQLLMIGLAAIGFGDKLVLIEEPELHLHPRAQKLIIRYLQDNVDARFVIATHSAAMLDTVDADIVHVSRADNKTTSTTVTSSAELYRAIRDLGHSPSELLQTRFAVWVEGPSDRIYLNLWIKRIAPELVEGVDYSILFYGGSILAQHSFEDNGDWNVDEAPNLVRALSLSRAFAVMIDSDQTDDKPDLRETKVRIRAEVQKAGGLCWITDGREVENYIGQNVLATLAGEFSYVTVPTGKLDQILMPKKANKVAVAKRAAEIDDGEWPLDLKDRIADLVASIRSAR